MRGLLLIFFLFLNFTQAYSQNLMVSGSVQSADDTTGLPGAAARLEQLTEDSSGNKYALVTDLDGSFRFEKVVPGEYTLRINFMGFKPFTKTIQVGQKNIDLGRIVLEEESITLKEVQVIGRIPLGKQMGDTTQFNARAFKTSPNANAENLVEKMPGITVQDGKIQAQGEEVQEILVDGKRYFEGDVEAALKNLPADVIESIQILDRKSDQAQFSGFDDGDRTKTINIVTKPDRRRGVFGQASVGYGTDDKYLLGASLNFFNDDRRITLTGITNNINTNGYSIGETPGVGLKGNSDGNRTTNRLSLNYNNEWGEKLELSGSYKLDRRTVFDRQLVFRDYILPSDSGQVYNEESRKTNTVNKQQLRMRLEYDMDEYNELIVKPRVSIEENVGNAYFFGHTVNEYGPINQTQINSTSENASLEFENEVHYRHRFAKRGRTFSTSLETSYDSDMGETYRVADNIYYKREDPDEVQHQYRDLRSTGLSWEGNASYTEPVGDSARIQLEYEISNRVHDSDRRMYNMEEETEEYTQLDTLLSNTFKSNYIRQEAELGYQYNVRKLRVELEAEYQQAKLQNDQRFPRPFDMERPFHSFLPSAELEYRISESKNIRLDYRTGTSAPSLNDLQDVIDNSNPLQLRTGNPNLRQSYQNRLFLQYKSFKPETNQVFYARLDGSHTKNTISRSTIIAVAPTRLSDDILLERGSQLIRPVNLDEGNWNIRAHFNYGQPVALIKSNVSFNGSLNYSRKPGMINSEVNFSTSRSVSIRASLSSNISEKIDFNISTRSNYNVVENTLRPQLNNNFFRQSTRFRGNLVFREGIIFRTELRHQLNTGMSAGFDNNYLLWNMSISKTLFDQERGEISLSVNDLLKQNNNINRNVTELYIEDTQSNVLQQFFMLSFTYSIRHFAGG